MPFTPSRRLVLVFATAFVLSVGATAHADFDLTGRWYDPRDPSGPVEIVQSGSDVTVTWPGGSLVYTGTFDQVQLDATSSGGGQIHLGPSSDGSFLSGVGWVSAPSFYRVFLSRCECFDGNFLDGDGCDSECRVEECYTCSGDPSVCTASSDGAACNDRSDCTTGETCTAGTCGAGTPVVPCVDVSGDWRISWGDFSSFLGDVRGSSEDLTFEQENGAIRIYPEDSGGSGMPSGTGSIDPVSGALDFELTRDTLCWIAARFAGTVASDSATLDGMIRHYIATGPFPLSCGYSETACTGTRCDDALGCDLEDCTGYPDGTPCGDGDICTNREACVSGECAVKAVCNICESCNEDGQCDNGPSPDCRPSATSTSSSIMLRYGRAGGGDDIIRWSWKKGPATSLADFADAAGAAEMALCLYDEAGLFYQYDIDRDAACETPPCWSEKSDRLQFKSRPLSLLLRAGADGRSSVQLKSQSANFAPFSDPLLPVSVPLRSQLRIENGACFDSVFLPDGVKRSDDGLFKAKGGLE